MAEQAGRGLAGSLENITTISQMRNVSPDRAGPQVPSVECHQRLAPDAGELARPVGLGVWGQVAQACGPSHLWGRC